MTPNTTGAQAGAARVSASWQRAAEKPSSSQPQTIKLATCIQPSALRLRGVEGGADRVDPSSLIKALRNGRELAGILLGLPRGALTRLVPTGFLRHHRSRACAPWSRTYSY